MSDMPIAGNTAPLGAFAGEDVRSDNEVVAQNYAGAFVDIVAIEADVPTSTYASYDTHPDFLDDEGSSRFVRMNWNDYDANITETYNRQITNPTLAFTSHAIGVLSAAAGLYCGWAKVSSLRVIYLGNSVSEAYNAVLAWHNSKPVNPLTGKRNATVTTGAWGYVSVEHIASLFCDSITQIQAYDTSGTLTTINRPGGGWGSDLSPFYNNGIVPRVIRDPVDSTDKWCISIPITTRGTFFDTIMNNYNSAGGIYHFKSAGNNAHIAVKPTDPRWNTQIITDTNPRYIDTSLDVNGRYVFSSINFTGTIGAYPLRTYIDGATNMITVGASQHSTANPLADNYSNRGPMVDIFGLGANTWTAYPVASYLDGTWGYFSGTSCAAPTVAGLAAVMIDHFYTQRGVYPTTAQLKTLMSEKAKAVIEDEDLVDFSNAPTAGSITSSRLYSGGNTNVYRITENAFQNGGLRLCDLEGASNLRAFVPYNIRLGNGKYISPVRKSDFGNRPANGQVYPRRKIKLAAS
jgi:hypothetical protein